METTRTPHTSPLDFPGELLEHVLKLLDRHTLSNLSMVNKAMGTAARPQLYRIVELDLDQRRLSSLMATLMNDEISELVRHLIVDWDNKGGDPPILLKDQEGTKLLRCLKRLCNLQSLTLNLTLFDSAEPLKSLCVPFKLHSFSTTLPCRANLIEFLRGQGSVRDLCIDSDVDAPGNNVLDGLDLPELRVLRWGQEPTDNPAAFEIMNRMQGVQEIHVAFSEPGVMRSTIAMLRSSKAQPPRVFFTLLFNETALSLVSESGVIYIEQLSLIEKYPYRGCFDSLDDLHLSQYPQLVTLTFVWTADTWLEKSRTVEFKALLTRWLTEERPRNLRNISFKIEDSSDEYQFERIDNVDRFLELRSTKES